MDLNSTYKTLRNGAEVLALQTAVQKNRALEEVAKALDAERAKIITVNKTASIVNPMYPLTASV